MATNAVGTFERHAFTGCMWPREPARVRGSGPNECNLGGAILKQWGKAHARIVCCPGNGAATMHKSWPSVNNRQAHPNNPPIIPHVKLKRVVHPRTSSQRHDHNFSRSISPVESACILAEETEQPTAASLPRTPDPPLFSGLSPTRAMHSVLYPCTDCASSMLTSVVHQYLD